MHLGVVDSLAESERDQQAARHIVDTLQMLKQKTTGNLASDEQSLLSTLFTSSNSRLFKQFESRLSLSCFWCWVRSNHAHAFQNN